MLSTNKYSGLDIFHSFQQRYSDNNQNESNTKMHGLWSLAFHLKLLFRCETKFRGWFFFEKEIERENLTSIGEFVLAKYWDVQRKYFEILTGELYSTDWISSMTLFISES